DQIRWSNVIDRTGIEIRRKSNARKCRIASIRSAHDADMLWIGDAFSDQILHAPGYIVLHLVAPLLITGVDEFLAIAGRAAEVWLQHRIAAVGPELGERIVAPTITPPRSTVRENDDRQVLWRYCFRQRK